MFQKIIQITKSYSLITSSGEKLWHDLTLKKLSALLKGITLKKNNDGLKKNHKQFI